MTKSRNKSLIVLLVAFACIAIVGVTFAWAGFKANKETSLSVLKVSLDVDFSMQDSIANVARGEEIVSYVKFSPKTNCANCYVRAKLVYKSNNLADDNVKKFLLSANYEDFDTASDTTKGYKWVKHTDGYHYLVGTDGTIFEYTKSTATSTDQTVFCENITYKGAVSLYGTIDAPDDLTLYAEVQAVQSKNITDTSLGNLSTIFTETFGADPSYGHIVTFVTNTNSNIVAQTFFNDTSTVTAPADPYKLGYTFQGWYTDSDCTTEYDFNTTVTNSFTLYAKFKAPFTGTFGYYDGTTNISDQFNEYYYVDYGYYPQSLASDVDVSNLTTTTGETFTVKSGTTPCLVYEYNGKKYIKYNTSTSDTTQVAYEVEPVRWLILGSVNEDQTTTAVTTTAVTSTDFETVNGALTYKGSVKNLLVLSEKVLVQQKFNSSDSQGNRWSTSEVQTFMKDTLLYDLFTTEEIGYIKNTSLKTTYYSSGVKTGDDADTSTDKLFLLSCAQSTYTTDTFNVQSYLTDYASRQAKATDLGFATGCYNSSGYTYWWLRAGSYDSSNYACHVSASGYVGNDSYVNNTLIGVRAAFVMDIA